MVGFKGSTQEKRPSEIFRFGYGKAVNDKMVPDPVGSVIIFLFSAFGRSRRGDRFLLVLLPFYSFS